jgi:hypothetical protein
MKSGERGNTRTFAQRRIAVILILALQGLRPRGLRDFFLFVTFFYKKVTKEIARIKVHLLVG